MSLSAIPREREAVQKQIQQDWANREYIEVITGSIKKITDFLNSFGKVTCRFPKLVFVYSLMYLLDFWDIYPKYFSKEEISEIVK